MILCLMASKFVTHHINLNVAHDFVCLDMLTLLLETLTERAIGYFKKYGLKLSQVSPKESM